MFAMLALGQSVVTAAPPTSEARAATTWSCQFIRADASSFRLRGFFSEAPVGSDPNVAQPTLIEGESGAPFTGKQGVNVFDSTDTLRSYMVSRGNGDGSRHTMMMLLLPGENTGLATVTHYVPDPAKGSGQLRAYATGYCSATFHPLGFSGSGK